MVTFPFTVDDLARTRFAISPMWELMTSLRMLQDAGRAAAHIAWVREAMPVARQLDLAVALRLTPAQGYMPDFLTPPPTTPVATFEDELETLCATPAATVRGDVGRLFGARRPPALLDPLLAHPRRELKRMAAVLAEFWELTLEPHWPRIRALLEADLAYRARCLTERGAAGLFTDLHGSVVWENDVLELRDSACEGPHSLGGKGLLLVPSAFQWQRPATIVDPPWQPTLLYPARGVGLLWEQPRPARRRHPARRRAWRDSRPPTDRARRTPLDDGPRGSDRPQRRRRLPAPLGAQGRGAGERHTPRALRALREDAARRADGGDERRAYAATPSTSALIPERSSRPALNPAAASRSRSS